MTDKAARRHRFEKVYHRIADELLDELRKENIPEEAIQWYHRVTLSLTRFFKNSKCQFDQLSRTSITMFQVENSIAECLLSIPSKF
jgi:chemotaxis methyl-accepting protein methylase